MIEMILGLWLKSLVLIGFITFHALIGVMFWVVYQEVRDAIVKYRTPTPHSIYD
jgi:hypothetical protein|tara:strand:+ start:498 stop:659 length:162 start_codon:yes stop_codon:yes gene_type:complete